MDDETCREVAVDAGRVVVWESRSDLSLTFVRDDDAQTRWSFTATPDGWTTEDLVTYVADQGVLVEPR